MKEKSVGVEGESPGGVATETQITQPSSIVTSFFKSELHAIKEKQGVHDSKQDKVMAQL